MSGHTNKVTVELAGYRLKDGDTAAGDFQKRVTFAVTDSKDLQRHVGRWSLRRGNVVKMQKIETIAPRSNVQ
jgi:hypothetical protein